VILAFRKTVAGFRLSLLPSLKKESEVSLREYGWNFHFETSFQEFAPLGLVPGRVISESREIYRVATDSGELVAEPTGRLRHLAQTSSDLPGVGDWVALQAFPKDAQGIVHAILPRQSRIARVAAGTDGEEQLLAANVDTLFVVTSLNRDFNIRRLERYLALARENGVSPVVVLSKADLCADADEALVAARGVAHGAPVHAVSAARAGGLDALRPYLEPGRTVALMGSSGVGKSTLVNRFLGREELAVSAIRADDDRGRHTTTRRELVLLPQGALLIDTPGMRELRLWSEGLPSDAAGDDVEAIAQGCRFRDCRHEKETDCAVRKSLDAGTLDRERLANRAKLRREGEYLAARQESTASAVEKRRWKELTKKVERERTF
jgi:ribosome biogenesis GTPase / thiamine phosphate phosphatase